MPGALHQATAGLHQSLLQARQRRYCQVNVVTATLGVVSAPKRQAAAMVFHVTNARERKSR